MCNKLDYFYRKLLAKYYCQVILVDKVPAWQAHVDRRGKYLGNIICLSIAIACHCLSMAIIC